MNQSQIYGYAVVPHYIQGIQVAVQVGHAIAELLGRSNGKDHWVNDWVYRDKTLIILRTGECSVLETIRKDIQRLYSGMHDQHFGVQAPVAVFKEPGLNDSPTALFTVIPKLSEEFIPYSRQEAAFLELTKYMEQFRLAH